MKSTAIPTLITRQVEEIAFKFNPVKGIQPRIQISANKTQMTAKKDGPGGKSKNNTIVTARAEVIRFIIVSSKIIPTIS